MFQRLQTFFAEFYGRVPPADETVWHKWSAFPGSVRIVEGGRYWRGQLWRRRNANGVGYQYSCDGEPTDDDIENAIW